MKGCIMVVWAVFGVLTSGLCGAGAAAPPGEGFRIDNRVFVADQKEPNSRSTTVFHEGFVYDFLDKPAETFVFDRARGQFTLLDTTRRISTRLTTQEVLSFTEQLRERLAGQKDPAVQFLLAPAFHETIEAPSGELVLSGSWMTYRVQTMAAASAEAVRIYREFSDWYARLGPILNPAARPPFARLMLNAALEEHGMLPRAVTLRITTKKGLMPKYVTVRSEHELLSRLAQPDMDRIAQSREFMAIFSAVSLEQYRNPGPPAGVSAPR